MDGTYVFFSIFFSIIGLSYFAYGKKQSAYFMVSGIILMIYPYAVSGNALLIILGVVFTALPFILDKFMPL